MRYQVRSTLRQPMGVRYWYVWDTMLDEYASDKPLTRSDATKLAKQWNARVEVSPFLED